ncbi:type II restriction endonuclease [Moraxella catarrhalis]|uniref:Type II restriction endonuclease n=1 Tax=Moraxella catarrhalis TaxID=480 RepID=A0A198ULH7_MORCA|nr:type II restriction endonuclease [Moraxella catarrhalis]OAU96092.1 type II restriction endonuclease [Moraxella catarrhalis]OAU96621.1 type II restriction endonuclease [Moraxella catarrhalis]OAV00488.1 type II restriction endonuclease [Moraxella catarrhalis]
MQSQLIKQDFENQLCEFVSHIQEKITDNQGKWSIKGFIDLYKNIYTISADTKIISKVLEIHIFPLLLEFAEKYRYKIVLAEHQNYYPDISFVSLDNNDIRFAVDFKTTYRLPNKPYRCNGFTLGSHGKYFTDRASTKNIQFPYGSYLGHYCLGIIYDRTLNTDIDETKVYQLDQLQSIVSVIGNLQFFVTEKWKIASDSSGSGNTANIGSISKIDDIINGRGMFSLLGEEWFDDYWINYKKIQVKQDDGSYRVIDNLKEFVSYRNGDTALIVERNNKE